MNVLNRNGTELGAGKPGVGIEAKTPEELGRYLQQAMLLLKADHIGPEGRGVDYPHLASSKSFSDYVEVAAQLVDCDPSLLSEKERMSFFISIHGRLVYQIILT